ncbi:hypothetical protein BDZ94DRAFT_1274054 [Collybia nuda]|uniref:Uncharacterized protein n=1 Tax=Collybia nuda TaxID=64659 RepID=A0A9P5XU63_9AGAR|nr:hypothetical protein BDZ94DRAFT_1274054 [Collybia nuda]
MTWALVVAASPTNARSIVLECTGGFVVEQVQCEPETSYGRRKFRSHHFMRPVSTHIASFPEIFLINTIWYIEET